MRDYIDDLIHKHFIDIGSKSESDLLIAQVLTYVQRYCPGVLNVGNDLTLASAVAALRRSAAVPRGEIAHLAGIDEAELGQWETQIRDCPSVVSRMGELLRCLLARVGQSFDQVQQQPAPGKPAHAMARSKAVVRNREPLIEAIEKAKLRARTTGKYRTLDERKCNWYRGTAHRADDLLRAYMQIRGLAEIPIPVPVDLIAEIALGAEHYLDHMADGDSGWFDPSSRRICVNADEPESRRRYTFAHEIGHAVMHTDKLAGAVHRDSKATVDESRVELTLEVIQMLTANDLIQARASERELRQSAYRETEANVFAAALVVPSVRLCEFIDQGITDSAELARMFGVSVAAMDWRLRFLDACMGIPEASADSQGQGTLF